MYSLKSYLRGVEHVGEEKALRGDRRRCHRQLLLRRRPLRHGHLGREIAGDIIEKERATFKAGLSKIYRLIFE